MGHLAQVSGNGFASGETGLGGTGKRVLAGFVGRLVEAIAGEGHFFDPPMNAGFFIGLKSRRLSLGQAWFGSAFGEDPAPAASLNQQEFQAPAAGAVANRCHLLASTDLPKSRRRSALC